jgi:hypothetical protein
MTAELYRSSVLISADLPEKLCGGLRWAHLFKQQWGQIKRVFRYVGSAQCSGHITVISRGNVLVIKPESVDCLHDNKQSTLFTITPYENVMALENGPLY